LPPTPKDKSHKCGVFGCVSDVFDDAVVGVVGVVDDGAWEA
jgi:hypothetical protein